MAARHKYIFSSTSISIGTLVVFRCVELEDSEGSKRSEPNDEASSERSLATLTL